MIAAYEGNLPFIFVSYAHKDSREVFDLIEKLAARGYRIWYDEGIEPGSEWPENIANHLLRAEMVLAMITCHVQRQASPLRCSGENGNTGGNGITAVFPAERPAL